MKGLIITGGNAPEKKYITHELTTSAYIIAADSGLDTCWRYGILPDLVVGDMDSLKNKKKIRT